MDTDTMAEVGLGDGMVDTSMNDTMEDLFGEAADELDLGDVNVNIPAASLPPPAALLSRLEEMRTNGCCTKLAWSNTGSIAHISSDGTKISFRSFARNFKTGDWVLSESNKRELLPPKDRRFLHASFNTVGQDLIAFDNAGQAHLYVLSGGNGKMQPVPWEQDGDAASTIDLVIGVHWLPIYPLECRAMYIGPVSRSISGWTSVQRSQNQNAVKVHHPSDNARAFLYISKTGKLTLCFQSNGWKLASTLIDSYTSPGTILSHADMCEHQGGLLLVTMDVSQQLRVFSVQLDWNVAHATGPSQTQQTPTVAPVIQVSLLAAIPDIRPRHHEDARLVQLRLIPATAEVADQSMSTSTTILATYVRANTSGHATGFSESSTIFVRWQVTSETPVLHNGFKNLKPNAQVTSESATRTKLKRQPDLLLPKIILSVSSICFDTILLCVASDGTIDFRDRATFDSLESYMDTDHVNSLPQVGFSYVPGEHNTNVATSYDGSVMVLTRPDDKVTTSTMILQYGWQRMDDSLEISSLAEAAVVAIARQYMYMTCGNIMPDEVLSLLPTNLPEDLRQLLTKEVFRLTRHSPDIAAVDEKMRTQIVLREPLLPRAFSLQLTLGTTPQGRTICGQYAWTVLNLRHVCYSVSQATMRVDPTQPFSVDLIHSLQGHARWGVDLIIYILHALMRVKEIATKDLSQPAVGVFEKYMLETNNPSFMLLLCSYSRTLLSILTQFLPRLIKLSQVATQRASSVLQRRQLTEVGRLEKGVPFTFEALKTLLDQTGTALQSKPPTAQMKTGEPSMSSDIVMTMTGRIPEDLEQALRALLISAVPSALQEADLATIYFSDVDWLGLDGPKSMDLAKTYDALKKTQLPENANVRLCRRCGSVMEDLNLEKPRDIVPWLLSAQRSCFCTGSWFIP